MYKSNREHSTIPFNAAEFLTFCQSYSLMRIAFDSTFPISISGSSTFSAAERGNTEGRDVKQNKT